MGFGTTSFRAVVAAADNRSRGGSVPLQDLDQLDAPLARRPEAGAAALAKPALLKT